MKARFLILVVAWLLPAAAPAADKPALAPLNPAFLEALLAHQDGPPVTVDGRLLGHMPSPLSLDHLADQIPRLPDGPRQYPAYYSICDNGQCPPVYDQGSCGSCWAFAAIGSAETSLLPDEAWDFSENNMIMHHGFNNGPCSGGGRAMATAYLVRWSGPVLESDDPYLDYSSPSGLPEQKHAQEVYWVTGGFDPYNLNHLPFVKHVLMNYGGLYWAYMHSSSYYNSSNSAYYYPGSSSANHAVTLVGWDDDFSRYNFNNTPPGDGAFILRNSWGTGFGEDGYFYASYYDASIEVLTAFLPAEEKTNFSFIYQHDWLGATSCLGPGGMTSGMSKDPETYWGANIFEANGNELLAATSFYTVSYNSSYRILVYLDVVDHPSDGTLAGELTGTIEYPGYHTIRLDGLNVLLTKDTRFAVAVEFHTPGYEYPVPVERPISGYTSASEASYGESFVRASEADAWLDLHGEYTDTNVCIKAFTQMHCDDGDACTDDAAAGGECVFTPLSCDDGNSCTADSCDSSVGCQNTVLDDCSLCGNQGACQEGVCLENQDVSCDDGNPCTQTDLCQQGGCVGTNPLACPASDQCHLPGDCDPTSGLCSDPPAEDGANCDDGDMCTGVDTCQAGQCTGAEPVICQASDQCHDAGVCDPASGACSDPILEDGTACDDGDACTQSDSCRAGRCTGSDPVVCKALDQCHAAGVCDPASGACSDPVADDGTTCDDGDLCTRSDGCQAGVCLGADPVVCTGADDCHLDAVCDPQTGECGEPPDAPDGTRCDDANACTGLDVCQAGVCQGLRWPDGTDCPEGACQSGECEPESGESATGCGCSSGRDIPALPAHLAPLGLLMALISRRRKRV